MNNLSEKIAATLIKENNHIKYEETVKLFAKQLEKQVIISKAVKQLFDKFPGARINMAAIISTIARETKFKSSDIEESVIAYIKANSSSIKNQEIFCFQDEKFVFRWCDLLNDKQING